MSFSGAHYQAVASEWVANAIRFVEAPLKDAEQWAAQSEWRPTDPYPYALGQAKQIIVTLLDLLGARDHGPDRFDCEFALQHPYLDDPDDWWLS